MSRIKCDVVQASYVLLKDSTTKEKGTSFYDHSRDKDGDLPIARARMSAIVNAPLLSHRYNFPSVIEGIKSAKFREPRRWRGS